jgi:ssDNA-binding Zn-finger/Zn-ribbon topoisomerase 1
MKYNICVVMVVEEHGVLKPKMLRRCEGGNKHIYFIYCYSIFHCTFTQQDAPLKNENNEDANGKEWSKYGVNKKQTTFSSVRAKPCGRPQLQMSPKYLCHACM